MWHMYVSLIYIQCTHRFGSGTHPSLLYTFQCLYHVHVVVGMFTIPLTDSVRQNMVDIKAKLKYMCIEKNIQEKQGVFFFHRRN